MSADNLYDHNNRPVPLGPVLGKGGEGNVYHLANDPARAAKLYHKPPSAQQAEKLRYMVSQAHRQELFKVVAWPTATLHDAPGGPVVGLLMQKVTGHKELHTLYSPAHRRATFPQADWRFLVGAALNCAIAFRNVHETGAVVGDVNDRIALVSENATVILIDCDSFQIRVGNRLFPCEVGVGLFTPPELQGRSFRGLERSPNHDRFGLALLIFHLLFMGRHPYAGRFSGAGEMPIEQAITEYRFAYSRNARTNQMAPPLHALTLDIVPAEFGSLFERAFGRGSAQYDARPTANDWHSALTAFLNALGSCTVDPGHVYYRSLPRCPWCDLIGQGAPNFFLTVAYARPSGARLAFALEAAWALIVAVPRPTTAYQRPSNPRQIIPTLPPTGYPTSIPPAVYVPGGVLQGMIGGIALGAGTLGVPFLFVSWPLFVFFLLSLVVFGVWWCILEWQRRAEERALNSERNEELSAASSERKKREEAHTLACQRLEVAEKNRKTTAQHYELAFESKCDELLSLKDRYFKLQSEFGNNLLQLRHRAHRDTQSVQLHRFLDQQYIRNFNVTGIGSTRTAILASYGIETALDITWDRVQLVPGFGPELTYRLLAWRQEMERRFVFDPSVVVTSTEEQVLQMNYLQERQRIEAKLRDGPNELKAITMKAASNLSQHLQYIRACVQSVAQTEADTRALPEIAC